MKCRKPRKVCKKFTTKRRVQKLVCYKDDSVVLSYKDYKKKKFHRYKSHELARYREKMIG